MVNSGLVFALARDLVTREIDVNIFPLLPGDTEELCGYWAAISDEFGVTEPDFVDSVVSSAVARYKSCRRQGRDYWGRTTDPLYLW
ncbi:hypothetical protein BH09PAT4_BH09PAT4_02330 [soil metagenome]